jgi:hypothetical protein
MKIEELRKPLEISEIDFRVQSINKGGYATILAYKDARVDINRLDKVCKPLGWKREHTRDNKNCVVSVWDENNAHWVSKEDTGTESNTEQQKGLASDSFKRACFNWGIGIELYDYPVIQVKLLANEFTIENNKAKPTWDFKLKEWVWISEFFEGELMGLSCKDQNGNVRFNHGKFSKKWLNPNTPEWTKTITWLKVEGNSIDTILKNYNISKENQDSLMQSAL